MKLNQITKILELECDSDIEITALNTLKDSNSNNLSFFENKKYLEELKNTKAGAVLVDKKFEEFVPKDTIAIITPEAYLKLALASKIFAPKIVETDGVEPIIGENCTIMPNTYIGKNSTIGENCTIMSGAFIGDNVIIGNDTIIYPNSTIYRDTKIGKNVIIHSGSVIGSDGFGFAHTREGKHIKIYQNGNVIIGDDVEIGSNSTIDRAVFGSTIIGTGSKIDNLVQIGHNSILEDNVIICGQAGIAGSTKLGKNVVLAAQSGTAGHLEIAPFTTIAARGGVTRSLLNSSHQTLAGFPVVPIKDWLKTQAKISRL